MTAERLVVELFTEELPPKAERRLGQAFADGIAAGLRQRGLVVGDATVTPYATPRRLGVSIDAVLPVAADAEVVQNVSLLKVRSTTGTFILQIRGHR